MKKLVLATLLSFSMMNSVAAVLPPLYESLKEYKALLEDPQLTKKLESGELIMDIERSDRMFTITTNKHTLDVNIVYDAQSQPGPQNFHFEFAEPIPVYSED